MPAAAAPSSNGWGFVDISAGDLTAAVEDNGELSVRFRTSPNVTTNSVSVLLSDGSVIDTTTTIARVELPGLGFEQLVSVLVIGRDADGNAITATGGRFNHDPAAPPPTAPSSSTDRTTPPESAPFPLDQLDPLEAARRVSLAARIDPTPDEHADLAVAGEIMRRDCMSDGGATPPTLTSADHLLVRDQVVESLRHRTRAYTTDGLAALRVDGFFPDAYFDLQGSESNPLWLPISGGSLEAQLIADGCGRSDQPLRAGPVEQNLNRLRATEVDGEATGSRWADIALEPQTLPEFADRFPALQDCMTQAGYPDFFDPTANPFAEFRTDHGVTEAELAMANAFADCNIATEFPTTYIETVSAVLDEFDQQHQQELSPPGRT